MFQELVGVTAVVAASMVGLTSIGNAVGRVFWAWVSDLTTRRITFLVMFLLQVILFWILPNVAAVASMTILAFVVLMCYGGGFGTMPAFAADYFGSKNVGPIYGLMLTAWGTASAVGPLLIAYMRQITGSYNRPLHVIAVVMAISALLPLVISAPQLRIVEEVTTDARKVSRIGSKAA
jgi:MFS transporter, OFA family, oxalate/formate antiporter